MIIVLVLIAAFVFLGGDFNLGGGAAAGYSVLPPHDNNAASGLFHAMPGAPGPVGAQWATTASALVPPPPGTYTRVPPPGAPPVGGFSITRPTITVAVRPPTGPAVESSSGGGHF